MAEAIAKIREQIVPPKLALSTDEAAEQLGLSKTWLEQLRVKGGGPKYAKVGSRVLYRPDDLRRWLEERVRENTSQ